MSSLEDFIDSHDKRCALCRVLERLPALRAEINSVKKRRKVAPTVLAGYVNAAQKYLSISPQNVKDHYRNNHEEREA